MMKVQFCVFLLILLTAVAFGAVSYSPIRREKQHGMIVKFCSLNGVRMLPGSQIMDLDTCMRCECDGDGLHCATMPGAFTIIAPEDSQCISVLIGCRNKWVRRNNTERRCPKSLIPTTFSGVGK